MESQIIFDSQIENSLVTIAIPTYKRDAMLVEAINSALNQNTSISYDIMVVDNNPERGDITEKAMTQFRNNNIISYYKNIENYGMIGNWNRLYELAKGKYVVMLHDDDMLFPYYLFVTFSLLEQRDYQYDLIYPSFHVTNNRTFPTISLPNKLKYRDFKREDYLVRQWGIPSGMMILKDKFPITGGFKMDYFPIGDQEFLYRALGFLKGCVIYFPILFYYIGVNESMKPETANNIVYKSRLFNHLIRKDNKNSWRLLAFLSYRYQINSISKWIYRLTNSEEIVKSAKDRIGFKDNKMKDKLSFLFVDFLNRYLNMVRIHYFYVPQ